MYLGLLSAGVLLVIIVAVLLYRQQQAKRKQLLKEASLKEELAKVELRQKMEAERLRISRDLHDHIGTQLTIISSEVDNLAYVEKDQDRKLTYEQISDQMRDTMAQLRETIWAMNNDSINVKMLAAKLQEFGNKVFKDRADFTVQNKMKAEVELGPARTINMYRICQEAMVNALKHAECDRFRISFDHDEEALVLSLEDNGKGMDLSKEGDGHGLLNMRDRMKQLGGDLKIDSELGKGTRISLSLQLNTPSAL